jgi:hypothetical protein
LNGFVYFIAPITKEIYININRQQNQLVIDEKGTAANLLQLATVVQTTTVEKPNSFT